MKTYKTEVEKPLLVIEHDQDAESPRKLDDNAGYFLTKGDRYKSPDTMPAIYKIMLDTGEEAEDQEAHIDLMRKRIKEELPEEEKVMEIYPIYRHEHGNVIYRRGRANGFDYSNCGFYIITAKSQSGKTYHESFEPYVDEELERYTAWMNGEVYRFTLYDDKGEVVESVGDFYDLDDIKGYLGEEWKDEKMEDYLN